LTKEILINNDPLHIINISKYFGGIQALDRVTFDVKPGTIHSIIGPNGAGKTTLINCISGQFKPEGKIRFGEHELTELHAHQRIELGIARTFQHLNVYPALSVLDNIKIGGHHRLKSNWIRQCIYWGAFGASTEEGRLHSESIALLKKLNMLEFADKPAGELSYGQQKRLEMGRALLSKPKLLLLDEPMAGMTRYEKEVLSDWILEINQNLKITIMMIEHDISVVKTLSNTVVVLDFGKKIAEGLPDEVVQDKRVRKAYLGED
jgi:branched-chain amino acid transport system ATP-binding protein